MEPHAELSAHLLAFVDVLQRMYTPILEQTGLTRLRWAILHLADERAPLTLTELTKFLDMPKSNVTYHIDWLEEAGYVERRPSSEDRRVTFLAVTEKGLEKVHLVPGMIKERLARFAGRVPPEELALMDAGLKLLVERSALLLEDG
ncbi:MAG: MarR family transcriptional regulator [Cyanobacteria bacterium RYN_339]|nr:MarR family transcriptional regulator [Cyanobacteria bacterium RYN_339]